MTMDLDREVSLSLNFSSAFVKNSNHLDQVPSLPTQGFGYDFPSNLSRLGDDHLQNPSHSSLYQPQKGFEFGSSSTKPHLESHQIPENYSSSHYETYGHYNLPYIDSSSLYQPQKCFEFGSSSTKPQLGSHQIPENYSSSHYETYGHYNLPYVDSSSLYQPLKGFEFGSSSTKPQLGSHQIPENYSSSHYETYGHYILPYIDSSSLYRPLKGFEFGSSSTKPQLGSYQIPENYSSSHYETYGHYNLPCIDSSSLYQPQKCFEFGSSSTKVQLGSHQIPENDSSSHYETYGHYNLPYVDSSSLYQPKKGFEFTFSSTKPHLESHQISESYNFPYIDSSSLSSSSLPLESDKGKIRENGSDGIRIQDDDNQCDKGERNVEEAVGRRKRASNKKPKTGFGERSLKFRGVSRRSKGFAKGTSEFRGVSRTSNGKKWQARMGKRYLGTFDTEEEAARAYDIEVIRSNATSNFDLHDYDVKSIEKSEIIPVGERDSKSLQRIPAKEILKRKTKDVKKPGALKLEEQSLVVPRNQNTQNIIPPPPQNPSYPQVILDLQGADHGKIDAQNVPTLQEDQSLISDRNLSSPSLSLYGNEVPDFLNSLPSHETTDGFEDFGFFEMLENPGDDFLSPNPSSPTFYPHQNPDAQLEGIPREGSKSNLVDDIIDLESLLCQSPNSQNFPTFRDGLAAGASSGTGSISGAIFGSRVLGRAMEF